MYESLTKFLSETDALQFSQAVYEFINAHPELELNKYNMILRQHNITSPKSDVSAFDGKIILAMIVGIVRRERFHEGFLQRCIDDDSVAKCLLRLKELDEPAI